MEEKKNLNWSVPRPIADAFDEYATRKWGEKRKWAGAAAAIFMFLAATEEERVEFELRVAALMMTGQVDDVLDSVISIRKAKEKKAAEAASRQAGEQAGKAMKEAGERRQRLQRKPRAAG